MTVGIAFSSGLEAILLCDEVLSLVSADGTTEDTVTKLGAFEHNKYHGAIVGAGDGNMTIGGISAFSTKPKRSSRVTATHNLDQFVGDVISYVAKELDANDKEWLAENEKDAEKKAGTIPDASESREYLETERARIFREFDDGKHQQRHTPPVQFLIAAYDGVKKNTRVISIKGISSEEIAIPHYEIGNGAKAARLYFAESMQGVEPSSLTMPELAFYTSCAFMKSTIEAGVGGTPHMVFVSKTKVSDFDSAATAAMTNVCGYYLAGALTKAESRIFVNSVTQTINNLEDGSTIRREVESMAEGLCQKLNTTTHDLVSATHPLSWIYRTINHKSQQT